MGECVLNKGGAMDGGGVEDGTAATGDAGVKD